MTNHLKSLRLEDAPRITVQNQAGEPVGLSPVYSLALGEPHVCDQGMVHPPIMILSDGGNEESSHIGVYFMLSDPSHMRAVAEGLLDAANQYAALVKAHAQ